MAKIQDSAIKETSGGYVRLFGNEQLGRLFSKAHSAVISSGVELEKLILDMVPQIDDLDAFLDIDTMPDGVLVASKPTIKRCRTIRFAGSEPDFMIFKRRGGRQRCIIVELKDGHTFDTKKSQAENVSIHSFISENAQKMPYTVSGYFCAFNQEDKQAILRGFKNKITLEECMTGREFCELLEIGYDAIVTLRKKNQQENIRYFLSELLEIPEVRDIIGDFRE